MSIYYLMKDVVITIGVLVVSTVCSSKTLGGATYECIPNVCKGFFGPCWCYLLVASGET